LDPALVHRQSRPKGRSRLRGGATRRGARVDDKRTTVQKADSGRAIALHYAAKAGFVKTIMLLLDRGADPATRDDNGLTPLDWLERASKSVDRDAVRRLLIHHRRAGYVS
jgi:ankyrin repeat protein